MPGTLHLKEHKGLAELLEAEDKNGTYLAAICAAPSVFGGLGLTEGKKASIYPGMEEALVGANVSFDPVSVDGHLVTSRGVGTAIPFALKLVELLCDSKKGRRNRKIHRFLHKNRGKQRKSAVKVAEKWTKPVKTGEKGLVITCLICYTISMTVSVA